jgi:thioredoxin reductase (NADPH)
MSTIENVIIIGSWPAGHTAAVYAWRAMLEPLMFEWFLAWGIAAGGQLTTTTDVENYPWFPDGIMWPDLMLNMRQQSINSWTRIETKTVTKVDLSQTPFKVRAAGESEPRLAKTLIISTGAIAKRLWLDGEETYRQRGISACAVCDGALPMYRNQPLVVIGGWDSACEEANFLTKFGSKVTMLVRRDELRASKVMQQRVFDNPKIEILWNTQWKEITGDDQWMTGITITNNKTWEESGLDAVWLFYAIGHKPATNFLEWQVELDESGYIMTYGRLADEYLRGHIELSDEKREHLRGEDHFHTSTSVPWVFAAGDVADKVYRQAITSAGTGCQAALEVEHYLQD